MKPAVEKQLKTQVPTPLVGNYTVRLMAINPQMVHAVIEHDGITRTAILPASASADWMKYMRDKYVIVKFKTARTQTEVDIQDRVGYINNVRVYVNSKNENGMPKIMVET